MPLPDELSPVLHVVEIVAGAVREALGAEIDAYPGANSPERADPTNRAFRAVATALLLDHLPGAADLTAIVSAILREATQRRLSAEGWNEDQIQFLIALEPSDRDDWLVFLLLSSTAQVEPLFTTDGQDDS